MDQEQLDAIIQTAQAAGAEGVWLLRGTKAANVMFAFDIGPLTPLKLEQPHELVMVIRFPAGDGGEAGIESR